MYFFSSHSIRGWDSVWPVKALWALRFLPPGKWAVGSRDPQRGESSMRSRRCSPPLGHGQHSDSLILRDSEGPSVSRRSRVIPEGPPEQACCGPQGGGGGRRRPDTSPWPWKKTINAERRRGGLWELTGGESDFPLEQGRTPSGMRWLFRGSLSHERGAE